MKTLKVITAQSALKTHLIRDRHQDQYEMQRREAAKNSHHEKQTEKRKKNEPAAVGIFYCRNHINQTSKNFIAEILRFYQFSRHLRHAFNRTAMKKSVDKAHN